MQVGDVVRLKSGSIYMTVRELDALSETPGQSRLLCLWFDSNLHLQEAWIPRVLLVSSQDDPIYTPNVRRTDGVIV